MSEKKKWALPSGAKEKIGPKWRKQGQKTLGGSARLFFRSFETVDDFT